MKRKPQQRPASALRDTGPEPAVCLRLTRGSAARSAWFLEDAPGGTTASIGADAACDWQIEADGVPPHAISVLLLSGNLFVRSTCQGDVSLNGSPLGDSWAQVHGQASIGIGLARFEVSGETLRSGLHRATPRPATAVERYAASTATQFEFNVAAPAPLALSARQATPDVFSKPHGLSSSRPGPAHEVGAERVSQLGFAPSLFGDEPSRPRRAVRWWLYVLAGLVTVSAYLGWLLALDEI